MLDRDAADLERKANLLADLGQEAYAWWLWLRDDRALLGENVSATAYVAVYETTRRWWDQTRHTLVADVSEDSATAFGEAELRLHPSPRPEDVNGQAAYESLMAAVENAWTVLWRMKDDMDLLTQAAVLHDRLRSRGLES